MMPPARTRPGFMRFFLAVAVMSWAGGALVAQPVQPKLSPPRAADCLPPPPLPQLPEKGPRPEKGPDSLPAFIDHLGKADAAFEVTLGQGRILTLKQDLGVPGKKPEPFIAVGDPALIEFLALNARQIRVIGMQIGVTDLAITTGDGKTYSFEVRVVADLNPLRGQLYRSFPDAVVRLSQLRDHVVVEGQVRDSAQATRVIETVKAFMDSITSSQERKISSTAPKTDGPKTDPKKGDEKPAAGPLAPGLKVESKIAEPKVINLLRIPGPQQVLLKVQVAELNRTALREIGADMFFSNPNGSSLIGTKVGASSGSGVAGFAGGLVTDAATLFTTAPVTTAFGIFDKEFVIMLRALRRNSVLKILAEPNLVAMNGHRADFLAGGEFPVPVPQTATGGAGTSVTVQFKEFGVKLGFLPQIMDGGVIRLAVHPEVSSIDFSIGTIIVPGGSPVPGVNTRRANTTVEIREGQTLAIAGLLQVTLDAQTGRIPGLGDLPILGPFFSNTTSNRIEKEMIVLVTPYLVDSLTCAQVPMAPGMEVHGSTDLEFYLGNRIEGRTGRDWRATTGNYASAPVLLPAYLRLHQTYVRGPHGFSD